MKRSINLPDAVRQVLWRHLFQSRLEQGAFLFAEEEQSPNAFALNVKDLYLIPADAWAHQMEVYLEMKDEERGRILKMARDKNLSLIDCHSHPGAEGDVWFSPSDRAGIAEFAQYAKWKLPGHAFAAIVCGESSVDAVLWSDSFECALPVDDINFAGERSQKLLPTQSWFTPRREKHRFYSYGK